MKTRSSPRPRFVCRFVRLWRSVAGDDGANPSGHVAHCAECRKYFGSAASLDALLRRDAAPCAAEISSGLERRIALAVATSRRETRSHAPLLWLAGAAAAAIAMIFVLRQSPAHPDGRVANSDPQPIRPPVVVGAAGSDWEAVLPRATALATENPLQHEIEFVYSDARSALRFLALNFLPSSRAENAAPAAAASSDKG